MSRRTALLASTAAALLLVGVVTVRDGTAVDAADLAPAPAPSSEPSSGSSAGPDPEHVLSANGIPGVRLGTRPTSSDLMATPRRSGAGVAGRPAVNCHVLWEPQAGAADGRLSPWNTMAWVRDGMVVSVLLQAWDTGPAPEGGLRTWLGPTLGSPMQVAQELPGAGTAVHRPFGDAGVEVTVVTVPLDGAEVVFGDAPPGPLPPEQGGPARTPGPITSIEVRRPEGRPCDAVAAGFYDPGHLGPGAVVDAGGVGPVRLGADADQLVRAGVLAESLGEPPIASACRWLFAEDLPVSVQAREGIVTSVSAPGSTPTDFGLTPDATLDELVARFPELAAERELLGWDHQAEVDLGSSLLRLDLSPETASVPDLEQLVFGPGLHVSQIAVTSTDAGLGDDC